MTHNLLSASQQRTAPLTASWSSLALLDATAATMPACLSLRMPRGSSNSDCSKQWDSRRHRDRVAGDVGGNRSNGEAEQLR